MNYYKSTNIASLALRSSFEKIFKPYRVFGGTTEGVYKTDTEAEITVLDGLVEDPASGVSSISESEYQAALHPSTGDGQSESGGGEFSIEAEPSNILPLYKLYFIDPLTGTTKLTFTASSIDGSVDLEQAVDLQEVDAPNLTELHATYGVNGEFLVALCPSLATINMPKLATVGGRLHFEQNPVLLTANFPKLASIDFFDLDTCLIFPSLSLPLLETVGGIFECYANPEMTVLDLPSLVSVGAAMTCYDNSSLTTVNLPVWVPLNGAEIHFHNGALSVESVDGILARCVANPDFVSGTITLQGGTNSAPSSVAPGSDYDVLIDRGVTVTVN